MSDPRVVVVTRAGCHLCEVAVAAAREVAGEIGLLDVDGDLGPHAAQRAEWSDLVPVVLIDGKVHDVIRVDPVRLRKALDRPAGRRFRPW